LVKIQLFNKITIILYHFNLIEFLRTSLFSVCVGFEVLFLSSYNVTITALSFNSFQLLHKRRKVNFPPSGDVLLVGKLLHSYHLFFSRKCTQKYQNTYPY